MMNRISWLFTALFFVSATYSVEAKNSPFSDYSFEEAVTLAKKMDKPLFVKFYASWCAPCKWMEETTLQDEGVKSLLINDYVSIKVNIDDFDGFALKSKYEVRYLPTIIIFKNGRIMERLEESVGISRMTNLLERNKMSQPVSVNKKPENTSPREVNNRKFETPTSEETESALKPNNHMYRVQAGVFSKYENAVRTMNDLSLKTFEQVNIIHDYANGKPIYKVVLGQLTTESGAQRLRSSLKRDASIEAVVVKY